MKSFIQAVVVAAALAAPVAAFAQSNQPVTRAQVRAELVQLEQIGWRPGQGDRTTYPAQIQAAEAKVAAENGSTSGVGGVVSGSSESGARAASAFTGPNSLYRGH
jgi:opacity protein-like surface antigen